MWGTDGVRVFTVDDGWGWIFTAVEHWNAECVGWHVCKRGDRFAALQPISMGLAGLYGSTAAGAARGLALRMDHGSQYLSDHFTNQIKFWGIQPSYAFVAEPQTNGVAERFNRTLKEQIIHGRIYRNIAELRDAVRDFVELYNAQWIVEKNGYLSPAQARQAWHAAISIRPRRVRQTCVQGTGCATKVVLLKPRRELKIATLFFVAFSLQHQKWRYSYGRSCFPRTIGLMSIDLPVGTDNLLDESAMKEIISQSSYWEIVEKQFNSTRR